MSVSPARATPRDSIFRHAQPRLGRSLLELCTSALPYLALSLLSYRLLRISPLLSLALELFEAVLHLAPVPTIEGLAPAVF